jgi:NitT/TauT family transport system ATP-binding protein
MAGSPLVEFRDVTKRFGEGPVILEGISFTAQPGEFISLIGPSGCGKSTLLRLLAGLTPATNGSVTVNGQPPAPETGELAFVFQEPTLLPWLSVAHNVEVPQALHGVAAAERAATVARVLELVRLTSHAGSYPRQLSGGQKMRVSLARALALAPRVMLLDEPFGALDEMTREHLNEELLAIHAQQGWTGFFVTHSVAEAVFLSHRIFILAPRPGRIFREVTVPLAGPRTAETRLTRDYHELVSEVSRQLRSVEPAEP